MSYLQDQIFVELHLNVREFHFVACLIRQARVLEIEIQLQPTIKSKQQKLSDRERKILDEVFEEFGHMNRWKIVEITHGYPEWADPEKEELNAIPIPPRDILKAGNKSEEEISDFEKRQAEKSYLESIC